MQIKTVDLKTLKPWPGNPRAHNRDIDALVKSVEHYGWTNPILVQKKTGRIIAGHGRYLAAKKKGLRTVPVLELDLNDQDAAAYTVADNKLAENSVWDLPKLKEILVALDAAAFDVDLTGFGADEVLALLAEEGDEVPADADHVPAASRASTMKLGDLWRLGPHRLLCGDATSAAAWERLMGGGIANCVFTDPPYGVSYKARSSDFDIIEGDNKRDDALFDGLLLPAFKHLAARTTPTAPFYVWHASSTREDFAQALKAAGLVEKQYLIWAKPGLVLGHADYQWAHEPCFYLAKAGEAPTWYGGRSQTTVWRAALRTGGALVYSLTGGLVLLDGAGGTLYLRASAPTTKKTRKVRLAAGQTAFLETGGPPGTVWEVGKGGAGDYQHPTQKPVELAVRALENSSRAGDVVLDPFLGSGTTLLAAELRQRVCYGMELDPKYADVVVARWEAMTGQKAVCEKT